MGKQEFIDRLRAALSGRVSASLVEENITYYEEYINSQIRLGKLEENVMASLGDPRLIAKSIITANDGSVVNDVNTESHDENYNGGYYTERSTKSAVRVTRLPGWLIALIVIVVIVLILSAVFSIISALLPILLPVLVVYFFIKLFRDWLK